MNKKLIVFLAVIIGFSVILILYSQKASQTPTSTTIPVVASFYPLAHFAEHVGGQFVTVTNITPAGVEPHDFEPSPQDIVKVLSSKLFIFHGAGIDAWAEKIQPELQRKNITTVKITDHFTLLENDPHIWLDPVLAKKEVEIIRDALAAADPAHAVQYADNAARYLQDLTELDSQYRDGLATCQLHDIITSHAAFNYMAKEYGLNAINIAGVSPEEEPSPKTLADIAQIAKQKQIDTIFFESLVGPKLSETVANEIGAKTAVLNPLEGVSRDDIAAGKTYVSVMQENLSALQAALHCQCVSESHGCVILSADFL